MLVVVRGRFAYRLAMVGAIIVGLYAIMRADLGPYGTTPTLVRSKANILLQLDELVGPQTAGVVVAITQGLFEKEGIQVEVAPGGRGIDASSIVSESNSSIGLVAADRFLAA